MIIEIKVEKLQIGMFIDLSGMWMEHPFWKDEFEITSEKQIKKIINIGIKSVKVDTDRSKNQINKNLGTSLEPIDKKEIDPCKDTRNEIGLNNISEEREDNCIDDTKIINDYKEHQENYDNKDSFTHLEWNPETFMTEGIVHKFRDKNLEPNDRAKAVQAYSLVMMKNLFENPTAGVISASKVGIAEIVDVILDEDETSRQLMKIVSYDYYTYTHSVNVGIKAVILEKMLSKNYNKYDMAKMGVGFFLHDLGKVNIDERILNKPGLLTEEEMGIMRTHPEEGYNIVNETKQLSSDAGVIILQHHERDDGSGYPHQLLGKEIHPHARVCAIADVYDSLTGKRPYKEAMKPFEAVKIMYKEMGSHFNKELLANFILLFRGKKGH